MGLHQPPWSPNFESLSYPRGWGGGRFEIFSPKMRGKDELKGMWSNFTPLLHGFWAPRQKLFGGLHQHPFEKLGLKLGHVRSTYVIYAAHQKGGLHFCAFWDKDENIQKTMKKTVETVYFSIVKFECLDQCWQMRCHFEAVKKFWYINKK